MMDHMLIYTYERAAYNFNPRSCPLDIKIRSIKGFRRLVFPIGRK